jgi:hypothetical protein
MPDVKDAIIEIIKWIRESVRPVIVILVLAFLVFVFPHSLAVALGAQDGFQRYRFVAFLCFVGSIVWLITFPIERKYRRRKKLKYLHNLTQEERNALQPFILNAKKTQAFALGAHVARHLTSIGILTETENRDIRGHSVFVIDEDVYSYLMHNPGLAGAGKNSN